MPLSFDHQGMLRPSIREVTRRLNSALGGTLVVALAGSKDAEDSLGWAKEGGPQPRPAATKRLHFAYEQWRRVADAEGEVAATSIDIRVTGFVWSIRPRSCESV